MVGKIVLVKVYFTDLSENKIRPVYIFKKYDKEDYMFLPLSSNIDRNGIILDNNCLEKGNIDRKSVVVIPKIGIIHRTLILKEIGTIKSDKIKEIINKLCIELGCNN